MLAIECFLFSIVVIIVFKCECKTNTVIGMDVKQMFLPSILHTSVFLLLHMYIVVKQKQKPKPWTVIMDVVTL